MFEILQAAISFQPQRLATPLRLSRGAIQQLTQATVSIIGEANGRRASGHGTIYLSDQWAWPESSLTREQRDTTLRQLCERLATELPKYVARTKLHPLDLGLRLHQLACHDLAIAPDPPALARAMCASPFDAAIHDAAGQALNRSAFELYEDTATVSAADKYFREGRAFAAIRHVIRSPRTQLAAWYIVGVEEPVDAILAAAIRRHGYRCFKLKLTGRDNKLDVARTIEVYRAAKSHGAEDVRITVDTNEANPSVESVTDYLEHLARSDPEACGTLMYFEQPTSRDIRARPVDWRPVTKHVPVMIDEGLADLNMLPEALRQGYGGLALKTCKGHSILLVCAAWAQRHGLAISLQDLTNPGISLIHGALVGAHLPTINGAELNSPQFTPQANQEFAQRLPELFEPRGGVHRLPRQMPAGLGSRL